MFKDCKVKKIVVDIVCDQGQSWLKVVARNPIALDQNCQGGSQFGQRSFTDQVKDLVKCAAQNELLFRVPSVSIIFAAGVTKSLHRKISKVCNVPIEYSTVSGYSGGFFLDWSSS